MSGKKKAQAQEEVKYPKGVLDDDITVPDTREKPTEWVKVTIEQVRQAQKDFKLCGFDPDKMIALIRK